MGACPDVPACLPACCSGELDVLDWGMSNATLEEVFIKITRDAGVRLSAFT